jgi:hypothetical protein
LHTTPLQQINNADTTPLVHARFVSLPVFSKIIVYIAKRCIMDAKKILVNISPLQNASLGFRQQALAMRNFAFPRTLRYRTRKDKAQVVPYMPLYRNTMYYEHKGFFCQYPFDIRICPRILHSSSGIESSPCQSGRMTKCSSLSLPAFIR